METIFSMLFGLFLLFALLGVPLLLTLYHVCCLLLRQLGPRMKKWRTRLELLTLFLGPVYSIGYISLDEISLSSDWQVQLYNNQVHTPIATWTMPAIIAFVCTGIAGYLLLRLIPLRRMPPLVTVLGISLTYAGILVGVLWCIQICKGGAFWLALFPLNCILLALIQIKSLIIQWQQLQEEEKKNFKNPFLQKCNQKLKNSMTWPVAALILFLPLLGILIGILVLFGQSPDALIQAFTQTSDWNLSTKVSPQNIYYDEHYLCTVAAGGHRRLVKPVRMGLRHGHPVIVNRQLCIANAFEQILEERLPGIHRRLRSFYDTYGFPVARLIHSPYTADAVYILMKPLEWFFLAVIYFSDIKPENRIATQYLPPVTQAKQKAGQQSVLQKAL